MKEDEQNAFQYHVIKYKLNGIEFRYYRYRVSYGELCLHNYGGVLQARLTSIFAVFDTIIA